MRQEKVSPFKAHTNPEKPGRAKKIIVIYKWNLTHKGEVMLNKFTTLFIILILISGSLFAQEQSSYLLSLEVPDGINRTRLEKLDLPIYHRFENVLIAGASQVQLENLKNSEIQFEVIDESAWSRNYYIVTDNRAESISVDPKWGKVLFRAGEAALVKAASLPAEEIVAKGYQIAQMPEVPRYFRNERMIAPTGISAKNETGITDVLAEINSDSVEYFIQSLQDFGTRFLLASTRDSVASWIAGQFQSMGISDVTIRDFQYQTTTQKNVEATILGSLYPNKVYIVGGHHDSYSSGNPTTYAPGADDNASGTAAALEIARAIQASGYQPEATIKFITFAAEEYGLHGSNNYAQTAASSGMDVRLMINHDMISHTYGSPGNWRVDMNYYTGYEEYLEISRRLTETYTTLIPTTGTANSSGSDSYSFWSYGFPAFYFEEHDFSPYYHSPQDVITNYNMDFCAEVIKASAALLIHVSEAPAAVNNFVLVDNGSGTSLRASWLASTAPDLDGYHVYVGTTSGNYDTVYTVAASPFVIEGLTQGTEYFVGISAFDLDGNEGIIVERNATPLSIPLAPSNFYDSPGLGAITLAWSPNQEHDLLGYNIFRAESPAGSQTQLNSTAITDTFYADAGAQAGVYYYYMVQAVDSLLNASSQSDQVHSRVVSLDQGILIVDETADGDGSLFNPTDAEVDTFYSRLLSDFHFSTYDLAEEGGIKLADLGAYSSILWHGNDPADFAAAYASREDIRRYLDFGGQIFISSYLPSAAFANNTSYPHDFSAGTFIYDYLKISHVGFSPAARFYGAAPTGGGYDSISVDTTKALAATNYHIIKIESIDAAPGSQVIYNYVSLYPPTTSMGSMTGDPVGVEYLGSDFRTVVLSYPLYYMNFDEARSLVRNVMLNKFSEATGIDQSAVAQIREFELRQNYPNPFNPETAISYRLSPKGQAANSLVTIKVYDILGREIATLINEKKAAGEYQVRWDGQNSAGQPVASGVYVYRIVAGDRVQSRKMLLLR